MAELKKLLDLTVRYILEEWYRKEPEYVENPQFEMLPYYDQDETSRMIFPPILARGIPESHIRIGETTDEDEIFEKINKNVKDGTRTQIIDFCPYIGIKFSHFFAKQHRKTEYVLIDKLELPDSEIVNTIFVDSFRATLKGRGIADENIERMLSDPTCPRFEKHVEYKGDIVDFLNKVYAANGVPNMHFKRLELTDTTDISHLINPNKKLYCVGWHCPAQAGIYSLQQAVKHNAEAIAISISGMEFMPREISQLSTHYVPQWHQIMELAKGSRAEDGRILDRYDYSKPDERKLGFALKHVRVLDILLWLQGKGYNTKTIFFKPGRYYNFSEHLIYAYKKHDILA